MNASYQASLVNRHIRRFTGCMYQCYHSTTPPGCRSDNRPSLHDTAHLVARSAAAGHSSPASTVGSRSVSGTVDCDRSPEVTRGHQRSSEVTNVTRAGGVRGTR